MKPALIVAALGCYPVRYCKAPSASFSNIVRAVSDECTRAR